MFFQVAKNKLEGDDPQVTKGCRPPSYNFPPHPLKVSAGFLTIMTSLWRVLDYYDEFWGFLDDHDEFLGFLDYYDEFGNSRADFFEPGSRIPLPRSPGADFFETGSRNPPPQGAKRPGAPPKAAPGGFLEPVSKNSAPVDLGRGISTSENPWFLEPLVFRGRDAYMSWVYFLMIYTLVRA